MCGLGRVASSEGRFVLTWLGHRTSLARRALVRMLPTADVLSQRPARKTLHDVLTCIPCRFARLGTATVYVSCVDRKGHRFLQVST